MKRFLFLIVMINLFLLISVQICLSLGGVRDVFTKIDTLEGRSNSEIIDSVGTCEIELEMPFFVPDNNIKILVNGQTTAYFKEKNVRIAVKNNSLIEIDSLDEPVSFTVTVSDTSINVDDRCKNLKVITENNIAILGKIFTN